MAHTRIARLPLPSTALPTRPDTRPRRTENQVLDMVLAYLAQPQESRQNIRPCIVRCECVSSPQDRELWNELVTALEDGRPHQCYRLTITAGGATDTVEVVYFADVDCLGIARGGTMDWLDCSSEIAARS